MNYENLPSIKDLLEEKFIELVEDEKLGKVVGMFRENPKVKAVIVKDRNGNYLGILTEKAILRSRLAPEDRIGKYVKRISPIAIDKDLFTVIQKMVEGGIRIVPIEENGKIVGIVRAEKILGSLKNTVLNKIKIKDIMVEEVIAISVNDKISKAITIMRKRNVSRLPILDNGKIVGIITVRDIVEKVIYPRERAKIGELGEAFTPLSSPVKAIMTTDVMTLTPETPVSEFIELVEKYGISGVPIVENGKLVGILTIRDVLEYLLTLKEEERKYTVSFSGMELDEIDKEWVLKQIENRIIKRFKEVLGEEAYFYIHIKKIRDTVEQDNTMRFVNVRLRVYSPKGKYFVTKSGWDLYSTISNALDGLDEQLEKEKVKIRERDVYRELIEEGAIELF